MKVSPSYLRFYVTLLASLLVFTLRDPFVLNLGAQGLGELARQERARKLARQSRVTKVYTNEDLQREVIVDPTAATAEEVMLAETAPAAGSESAPSVPVQLTVAPRAIPSKEIVAPTRAMVERAVPTVPLWPAGMPLGDIARYYRQQIAPRIPSSDDRSLTEALAQQPALRDFSTDKLRMTLMSAPPLSPTAALIEVAAAPARTAPLRTGQPTESTLPAPFAMSLVEGSTIPVIENVVNETLPGFPSPAVKLELAGRTSQQESSAAASPVARREVLRFAAPEMGEVVLSFGSAAALDIPSIGGAESDATDSPVFDSSREPLTIRFTAPPTAPPAAPVVRTAEPVPAPQLRANINATSVLETVSPWRYVDDLPAAPTPAQPAQSEAAASEAAILAESSEQDVRIQRGDSLWLLALRHLGDGRAWPQIAAANPQLSNPHHIRAGERLRIPAGLTAQSIHRPLGRTLGSAAKPVIASTNASKSVTVQKGDSLWKLAESALGNGAAWSCIAEANPEITDADRIFTGQTLVLPGSCDTQS